MGSGAGQTVMPAAAAYSGSKHFMDGFREALAGFDRGALLVFPGRAHGIAMRALPLLPGQLSRRQAARSATRLRSTAKDVAKASNRPEGETRA